MFYLKLEMNINFELLNNREIATIIWLGFLIIVAILYNPIRKTFIDLIRAFANKEILIPFMLMILFVVVL